MISPVILHDTGDVLYRRRYHHRNLRSLILYYSVGILVMKTPCDSHPTTSISGNNVQECLLESDCISSCSRIPPLKFLFIRQVTGN